MGIFDKVMDDWLGDPFGSYHAEAEAKGAATEGIARQEQALDQLRSDLAPFREAGLGALEGFEQYRSAGDDALAQQRAYLGLDGPEAQQAFIEAVSASPELAELTRQGEEAMLQNASATGGLRGGNIQGALAQYRPQILMSLLDQKYSRLGGLAGAGLQTTSNLAQLGQASAAQQGTAGLNTAGAVSGLLGQRAATAGSGAAGSLGAVVGLAPSLLGGRSLGQVGQNLGRIGGDVRGFMGL